MEFDHEDISQFKDPNELLEQQRLDFSPILSRRKHVRILIKQQAKSFPVSRIFMTVRAANSKFGESLVSPQKVSEVAQLLSKNVFRPVHYQEMNEKQKKEAIRTTMIIDDKYHPASFVL
jgi:hypothetical protein